MESDKSKPSGFLFEAIARDVNVAEFAVFREYLRQITRGCTISEVVDFQTGHSLNLRWPSAAIEAHDDANLQNGVFLDSTCCLTCEIIEPPSSIFSVSYPVDTHYATRAMQCRYLENMDGMVIFLKIQDLSP